MKASFKVETFQWKMREPKDILARLSDVPSNQRRNVRHGPEEDSLHAIFDGRRRRCLLETTAH